MAASSDEPKGLFEELVQPFIDVVRAPRALMGVNLAYFLEGMVYFGILGYLAMHFSDFIFQGVPHADEWSHTMVMVLTAGITISMFFLGFVADRFGVRRALIFAFCLMLAGRVVVSAAPTVLGLQPNGLWSPLHLLTMGGILLIVTGYGMYQPAAYTAVRQFTTPKTAGMGFAMLYALMNLGGWLPTFAFLARDEKFLGLGIPGTFWIYTAFTAVALVVTVLLLSSDTVKNAIATAKEETERIKAAEAAASGEGPKVAPPALTALTGEGKVVVTLVLLGVLAALFFRVPAPVSWVLMAVVALFPFVVMVLPAGPKGRIVGWVANHPFANAKFFFFIFALMPVQTLFTYNWLILPQYISRAYEGWIGEYFEIASNANPILIFLLVPVIANLTRKAPVYNTMIVGTAIMAAPAFLLALGPSPWTLGGYILLMTIGEAIWQPRFLQYAAEIAPEGRTGQYMGVAQLPWFLTKLLVPLLYSGYVMDRFCPEVGEKNTQLMWAIFGAIAIASPVLLILAKGWIGKGMKVRA